MDYYNFIIPLISIYGSCLIGIFVALTSLNNVETEDDQKSMISEKSQKFQNENLPSPSESGSEPSSEEIKNLKKRTILVKSQNEIEFFRELGDFFRRDYKKLFDLIVFILLVLTIAIYFYLDIIFSLAMFLGAIDFIFTFWFSRKLFVKSILILDFSSNANRVCHRNWCNFLTFIFSSFIASISSCLIAIYTLLILFQYEIGPYLSNKYVTDGSTSKSLIYDDKNGFILLMAFYFVGKNLFHIFNNIWESYHMNNKILEFLILDYLRKKSLEFYSQGFYYNVIIRVHRQAIVFSEVLVILTIGVFQFAPKISFFFVYFYTILLWYIIIFYWVSIYFFNYKNSIEAIGMTTILKIGFLYYFIVQFMFIYYRYFMCNEITFKEANGRTAKSTMIYGYSLMFLIFLIQKILAYFFDPKEIRRLKALQQDSGKFEFFLNDKILTKLTATLLIVYMIYLLMGFIGVFFIFFYFSVQRLFYRIKKYILVFDLYIRILLWASRIAVIHSFTFNKLLELVDKTYVQNFFMLLFILPLFAEFKSLMNNYQHNSENYMTYLYISLVSFIISILMLILYTKLVLQKYSSTLQAKLQKQDPQKQVPKVNRIDDLIRNKMHFIVCALILTCLFVTLFYKYGSFYLVLSIIIGFSIHLMQLVYTNKIRVKKFLGVKRNQMKDDSFILKINSELSESTSYMKSVCELSFASILVEINKILLLTYFFLHNLR